MRDLWQRLSDADDNAEGHDLFERGRLRVSWGWFWTQWTFGVGIDLQPFGPWIALGPISLAFTIEVSR